MDFRHEIVTGALLNGVVIKSIDQTAEVRVAISKVVSPPDSARQYSLMNMAHVAGLMYCLLVVPRELALEAGDPMYDGLLGKFAARRLDTYFNVTISDDKYKNNPSRRIIPNLRHAVAHVNFQYDLKNDELIFWNCESNDRTKRIWEAACTREQLLEVLTVVGNVLSNEFLLGILN